MNDEYLEFLVQKWSPRGLLLDTNLFLLFAVGFADVAFISQHKNTRDFSSVDYQKLYEIVARFGLKLTLPNVQTELSNLSRQTNEAMRDRVSNALAKLLTAWTELYIPSIPLISGEVFSTFGLTDAALYSIADRYLVATADGRFAARISNLGLDVLNFNHFRF